MVSKIFPTDFPASAGVALTDVVLVDDGTSNLKATVQQVADAIGAGDVVGPASASNNAIARFDTTTGKLIQNSVVTITDVGAITGVTTINGNDATTLLVDADINATVQAYDADTLKADVSDQLTVGFTGTSYNTGNTGVGTVTLVAANGNIQHGTVTGAFTLGAPTFVGVGYIEWEATNDATGGYSPDVATNFDNISGTYDATALAVNVFRITKLNTGTYLEIAQESV